MRTLLENIAKLVMPKLFVYVGLLIFLVIFYKATMQRGYYFGTIVASLPFIAIVIYLLLKNPLWSFVFLFISNYFVMGAMRYIYFPGGILMDIIIGFCLTTLIVKTTYKNEEWKRVINPLTLTTSIWLLFCILELLNPRSVVTDWATQVRGMAVYPFFMVILVSVLLYKYKHLKLILFIWSILTIAGALKGYWQKNHGFDHAELMWLYSGGARTHLIASGIRYFSFFTDAGNYGSCMGFFDGRIFYCRHLYKK